MQTFPLFSYRVLWGTSMTIPRRPEALFLFLGDIFFLAFSLLATLVVRYGEFPNARVFGIHFLPFSFLFFASAVVFFIAGLYEKHTLLFKSKLPQTIFYAQLANIAIAALFFFFIPYFKIQPKTNLFIYLLFSTALVSLWRVYLFPSFSLATPARALLLGEGEESMHVMHEVNGNNRYPVRFIEFYNLKGKSLMDVEEKIHSAKQNGVSIVVMPLSLLSDEHLRPTSHPRILSDSNYVDLGALFEDIFDRVPLGLLNNSWFSEMHIRSRKAVYVFFKRITDVILSALLLIVLSPLILLVTLILLIGGGGAPFIFQKRLGKHNREIEIIKFRSMLFDDGEDPEKKKLNRITRLGKFLRSTQIDEIPQFWNVLRGDLSLVGPRPEIPHFVAEYCALIPYYDMRHLIQPGISGWAQIKHASPPKFKLDVEATKQKLSYDLYYLKHRSFLVDLSVLLQTLKILISRVGR